MVLSHPWGNLLRSSSPYQQIPAKLRFALLTATRLAGDEVGGASEEILLRGFVGRGGGEEFKGLEIVRLHHGVMGGGATTTGEAEQGKLQDE